MSKESTREVILNIYRDSDGPENDAIFVSQLAKHVSCLSGDENMDKSDLEQLLYERITFLHKDIIAKQKEAIKLGKALKAILKSKE